MSRMNRRRFTWVATSGFASAALVACSGSDAVKDDITPTRVSSVEGAPPTLAPNATPFASDSGEQGGAAPAAAGETITVTGLDSLAYDPSSFEAAPGQTIHFVNGGVLDHDINIDELGWDGEVVGGGGEYEFTIPDDAEIGAEYAYYCSVPGHREGGMEGTLTIVEAGGGEAAAASEEGGGEAAAGGGEPITVQALDALAFDPAEIEAAPGQDIHVVNAGALQHDFVVDEIDLATDLLNGGDEQTITVPEDAEVGQSYTYYCSVPGHREAGMEGTLTIVEAGGGEAAAAGAVEEAPAEETEAAAAAGEGGGAAGPIEVHALDALQFDPSEIEASPGQDIHVINDGVMQHDFVIDELEMATDLLNNGEEQTITVPDDAEIGASFTYYCSVPGHRQAGMEGTMTIVEGGGAAAAEEAPAEATEEAAAAAPAEPVDPSQPVDVTAHDSLTYDPAEITVAPGQTIRVTNEGTLQHDFVVDEWGLATALLNNGETGELVVPGDAEVGAAYTYYCSVPGHAAAGMQGTLTVAEAAGEAAAAEGTPAAEATEAAPQVESGAEVEPDAIRVASLDSMRFAPSEFSAAPSQQIHLVNPGVLVHDIVVDEWGLDSGPLGGGEETTFTIPEDVEIGSEIEFYCSVPGHRESGMVGRITIIEGDVTQEEAVTPVPGASPVGEATPAGEAATPVATNAEAAAASPAAAASGGGGDTIEVRAVDIAFEPAELTIPADTDVEIHVVNEGMLEHDFNIEDTDFATDILPGAQEAEATLTVNLPAGEYVYFCSVPGHRQAGMEGTLTVE